MSSIGCGMSAVKTSLTANDLPGMLAASVEDRGGDSGGAGDARLPVDPGGFHGLATSGWDDFWGRFDGVAEAVKFREERATKQMGTLGRGDHLVEICTDTTGAVWLMLHSGSRNIGKELAEYHIGVARSSRTTRGWSTVTSRSS